MQLIFAVLCLFILFGNSAHPFLLISSALIHELGHITAAKLFHCKIRKSRFSLSGIRIYADVSKTSYTGEAIIAFFGPAVSILSGLFALLIRNYTPALYLSCFASISLSIGIISLFPVNGLDGGVILTSLLNNFLPPDRAVMIAKAISVGFAFVFWILSVVVQIKIQINIPMLILSTIMMFRSLF